MNTTRVVVSNPKGAQVYSQQGNCLIPIPDNILEKGTQITVGDEHASDKRYIQYERPYAVDAIEDLYVLVSDL